MTDVSNSFMGKLSNALKNGDVTYTGGSAKNVKVELGKGDADVNVRGTHVTVNTGTGNQRVQVLGDDVDVSLDLNAAADWDFSQDYDAVAVVSNLNDGKVRINMGDGGGVALGVGKDIGITYGDAATDDQQQVAVVWGNKEAVADVTFGEGGSRFTSTMDKAAANGSWAALEGNFGANNVVLNAAVDALQSTVKVGEAEEVSRIWNKDLSTSNKAEFLNTIKEKYKLDDEQYNKLNELFDSNELFETLPDGKTPKYAILTSATQKNADNTPKYVVARIDSYDANTGRIHAWGYGYDSNRTKQKVADFKDCIATDPAVGGDGRTIKQSQLQVFNIEKTDVFDVVERQSWLSEGIGKLTVTGGNAFYNSVDATLSGNLADAKSNIKFGDAVNKHDININGAYAWKTEEKLGRDVENNGKVWGMLEQTGTTHQSPLIIDFNKDGVVSSATRKGVDLDGDGLVDGAATNGDKMLAMSDLNGNGRIDGAEVFGDKTVNPFTGQAINAKNGFEALKVIAQSAETATGIKCYQNGKVDLPALKQALATVNINLGYISDDNTSTLEELAGISAIDVDNYQYNEDVSGAVQSRQQGVYYDENGVAQKVDDVWFNRKQVDTRQTWNR